MGGAAGDDAQSMLQALIAHRAADEARIQSLEAGQAALVASQAALEAALREEVARLDAEIAEIRDSTAEQIRRVKAVFASGKLLVRTIDHACAQDLPSSGSTSLVWPSRRVQLMGTSSRRLATLYDFDECTIQACYREDAHTNYSPDHASHASACTLEELAEHAKSSTLYNEVVASQLGPVIGFALITPFLISGMEGRAKKAALAWARKLAGTTIVDFCETTRVIS